MPTTNPSQKKRRIAAFDAVLIFIDEPQLITLTSGSKKQGRIVAIAVPDADAAAQKFFAVSVNIDDWKRYLSGTVDLRYLFASTSRLGKFYIFDLRDMRQNTIKMNIWAEKTVPEAYLPSPKLFSRDHTEVYGNKPAIQAQSQLFIDGEWELQDFGRFQQRYADLYAMSFGMNNVKEEKGSIARLKATVTGKNFIDNLTRLFQGGTSYIHFFQDMFDLIPYGDRLNLRKIHYASPGAITVAGNDKFLSDVQCYINNYLSSRYEISKYYNALDSFLGSSSLRTMHPNKYKEHNLHKDKLVTLTKELCDGLKVPEFEILTKITDDNTLLSAKIALATCRRIQGACSFFQQGRISYEQ